MGVTEAMTSVTAANGNRPRPTANPLILARLVAVPVTESAILEQRENLPRLRHGVVDVDEREHRIEEAEAAIIFGAEGVLEHEHADSLDRLAPVNDFRAILIQPTAA
jgi:hypothetical protein